MLSTQVMSERACRLERAPVGPADSRTTLSVSQTHEVSFTGPAWPASSGLPSTGFSPATCSRGGRCWQPSAASLETRLPVKFAEEAMMHIHAAVPVSVHFIATMRTPEQFPPLHSDALALLEGEPLPQVSTARAILTGPMRVDFDGDGALREGFLAGVLVDLAAQLVCPLAVHAPRFACPPGADLAQ